MCYYNFYTSFVSFFLLFSFCCCDDVNFLLLWRFFLSFLSFPWSHFMGEKVLEIERSSKWSAESFFWGARFELRGKFIAQFAKKAEKNTERKRLLARLWRNVNHTPTHDSTFQFSNWPYIARRKKGASKGIVTSIFPSDENFNLMRRPEVFSSEDHGC